MMSPKHRYSRQILFKPIGETGQNLLQKKHVCIIGCGALGSANAENLVRSGVGKLTIIDRDYVELSNLQRQQLFTEQDVYEQLPKAIAAKKHLQAIHSEVTIEAYVMDATSQNLPPLLNGVDLVIDSTDNFDIRLILNDLLNKLHIPWIYGSCVGSTGITYTILPNETPCLQCLLDDLPKSGATCDSVGIIVPAVQMVTTLQTTEALKILVEDKKALRTKLVTFDLWHNFFQTIAVDRAKKENCPTCGVNPSYPSLTYEAQTKTEVLCGRNTVQIRTNKEFDLEHLAKRLVPLGRVKSNSYLLSLELEQYQIIIFRDGRTLVHGTNSKSTAKKLYYQLIG